MKSWLRQHPEEAPAGLDATLSTSHQLREGLLRRGWSLEETLTEVRLRPQIGAALEPSVDQKARRIQTETGTTRSGAVDAAILKLTSPQRFRESGGLEWTDYSQALRILDDAWRARRYRHTSFGVFGSRPSWEDTITRAAPLFDLKSWSELDDEQLSLIAPAHFFEDGMLSSARSGGAVPTFDHSCWMGKRRTIATASSLFSRMQEARRPEASRSSAVISLQTCAKFEEWADRLRRAFSRYFAARANAARSMRGSDQPVLAGLRFILAHRASQCDWPPRRADRRGVAVTQ